MDQLPPSPTSGADEHAAWLNRERHELICRAELSALYHDKRERFLLTCERLCQAAAAISATAAFSQLFPIGSQTVATPVASAASAALGAGATVSASWAGLAAWLALVAAIASTFPLVFAWSSRANRHATLAADHKRFLAELTALGYELNEAQLSDQRSKLLLIEANERASLGALVVQCQNEMASARGELDSIVPLRLHHRLFMHVMDWNVQASPSAAAKHQS